MKYNSVYPDPEYALSNIEEIDDKVIFCIKSMPEMAFSIYVHDLFFTNDWDKFLNDVIQADGKQKLTISEKTYIEILKFIIEKFPHCTSLLKFLNISQEARLEIGTWYAEKDPQLFFESINDFGIEICKEIILKVPTVMKGLPRLHISDQKSLLEILWLAAEKRPDLVMKSIHKIKIQDKIEKNKIMLQCINQIPSVALNSRKVSDWIDRHQALVFPQNPELEKMVIASKMGPSQHMRKVFEFFKMIADPSVSHIELAGRCRWLAYYEDYKKVHKDHTDYQKKCKAYEKLTNVKSLIKLDALTRCGVTSFALQYAVFGYRKCHEICLEKAAYRKEKLDEVWETIKTNEQCFDQHPSSHFFGYFFHSGSIDHCFAIIQYRDEQNQIKYKFLQSWVGRHSLNDYMEKHSRDLNSDKFAKFTKGLNHMLFSKDCTLQDEIFFKKYFMTPFNRSHFSQKSYITIKWNSSNREIMDKSFNEFEKAKRCLYLTTSAV